MKKKRKNNRMTCMDLSNLQVFFDGNFFYLVIFTLSFLESLVIVGLLTPGTIALLSAGFLISLGSISFFPTFLMAFLGAILGDLASFYLGRRGTNLFKEEARLLKLSSLEKARYFFKKHGGKSIFLGRFSGPLRSLVPFSAGLSKMPFSSFFFWNISSAFCWVIAYLLIGIFSGGALQTIEKSVLGRNEIFILASIFLLVVGYFVYRFFIGPESTKRLALSRVIFIVLKTRIDQVIFKSKLKEKKTKAE